MTIEDEIGKLKKELEAGKGTTWEQTKECRLINEKIDILKHWQADRQRLEEQVKEQQEQIDQLLLDDTEYTNKLAEANKEIKDCENKVERAVKATLNYWEGVCKQKDTKIAELTKEITEQHVFKKDMEKQKSKIEELMKEISDRAMIKAKQFDDKDKEIERLEFELQSNSRDFWKKEAMRLNGENITIYKCPACGRIRRHDKEVHTFVCECGNREWYPQRESDGKPALTAADVEEAGLVQNPRTFYGMNEIGLEHGDIFIPREKWKALAKGKEGTA
jgi:DNA-directed RNA polymerase subunit RPC12/RpoP